MPNINLMHLVLGGAVLVSAIPSLGGLNQLSGEISEARSEAKRISSDMVDLKLSQQEAEQKAAVADARYGDGCIPVVSPNQLEYVSLIENSPVTDTGSGIPLPAGSVVCDAHGNTAELVDHDSDPTTAAIAQSFAFTGRKEVVEFRLRQYTGARYSMPQN